MRPAQRLVMPPNEFSFTSLEPHFGHTPVFFMEIICQIQSYNSSHPFLTRITIMHKLVEFDP